MIRMHRLIAPLGVAALLATGGAAFLASNTQPASGEGVSIGVVDGYTISNIHYTVDPPPPPPNGPPPHLQVTTVSFEATTTAAGELPAAQGFVKLDPPPPAPPMAWTSCAVPSVSGNTSTFTCTFSPAVPVNGQPNGPTGWISSLDVEVNQ
ncbi:MAG: hypothetical protein M1115_08395 [Actinobacteria bacterium]|nr:hypothetical protein [Actinomycetota bacterium]